MRQVVVKRISPARAAADVAGLYCASAIAWIIFSDDVVSQLLANDPARELLQTQKGIAFVLVTTVLLYGACFRRIRALARTQLDLHESRRTFMALIGNLPGMAYRCQFDESYAMEYVSRGCAQLTGYTSQSLMDGGDVVYNDLIHPEDREGVRAAIERAVELRRHFQIEYRIRTSSDDIRAVWERGLPIFENDKLAALEGFVMDVTDRKAAERLAQERDNLREAATAAEQVLGVIGHELRTPLTGLRLMAESVLEDTLDDDQRNDFLNGIHEQAIILSNMANNMLESARLNSSQGRWQWSEVDVNSACKQAAAVIKPLAEGNGGIIHLDFDDDVMLRGDSNAIQRIVVNLLSNACKHTPHGHIHLRTCYLDRDTRRVVHITVQDDGRGMPPEVAEKIGQPFGTNQSSVGLDPMGGVGLGLAICRQLVAAHGGSLLVESAVGVGTTVTVELEADLEQAIPFPSAPSGQSIAA